MSVTVSLVTWRSRALLPVCLAGIRAQGPCVSQIRVVVQPCGDDTAAYLRREHPDVEVIETRANVGYAAGHNRSFAGTRGRWFLALNPDVVLRPGYVRTLVDSLERDPHLGAATGRLLAPGWPPRLDSAGILRTRGRVRFVDRGRGAPPERFDVEEDVFGACGAAALYRAHALRTVSRPGEAPFAERFFMYYEDVDLAWRLRRRGWRSRFVPAAEAEHLRGGSGARPAFVEYHLVRNRLWVTLRNARGRELVCELPGLALFTGVKLVQALRRPHLRRALRDQWRGAAEAWAAGAEAA